jgi:pimeloyl-ACP methyl ester carboxylesterase
MRGALSLKSPRTAQVGRPTTATLNGLRYHWREAGRGPLLVLLHGAAAHSGWFRWMVPRLATRYRVVAPDLRGNGRTGHADDYTWDAYAADVEALLDLLVGNGPYYLAGHCSGGYIGMLVAARGRRRPPSALVGMEVLPRLPERQLAVMWSYARRGPKRYPTLAALDRARRAYARRQGLPLDRGVALGREVYRRDPRGGGWVPRSDLRVLAQEPFSTYELAAQVPCPTLLLRGTESGQLNRIQFLLVAGALPRASFQELPGLGHHFMVEDPDATCDLVEEFFERVARSEAESPEAVGVPALKPPRHAALA